VDAWMPMAFDPKETANDNRGAHYLNVAGRLRPGATVVQATSTKPAPARGQQSYGLVVVLGHDYASHFLGY